MTDPPNESTPDLDRAGSTAESPLAAQDLEVEPRALDLISEVQQAGNITRELTTAAFEGDYASPSEILPTAEGLTLFRGAAADVNGNAEYSRRNGWHPDRTIKLVRAWIAGQGEKSAQ